MPTDRRSGPRVPPRWFVRSFWSVHRAVYRVTGGHLGLWRPNRKKWGALSLTTTGRRSGRERGVIIGYFEDGPNYVSMAMNGWSPGEPAWWLNLQAHPDAVVDVGAGRIAVKGRAATGDERARLWSTFQDLDGDLDAYEALRGQETAVVVLEPCPVPPRDQSMTSDRGRTA
ncbi:MAG: nitroreductase family deazaflavin-dependent oxidoreductase [Actinobacteria bacterium]|nr:nitroreductase family deazaflavin-dependent oxidoreductase [Actinomycetota bacterium]